MNSFLDTYGLSSLIHQNTCFKSSSKPTCIDLFLTNSKRSFTNSTALSTGISDFRCMIITVLKTKIVKGKPKIVDYQNYKTFDDNNFKNDLLRHLSNDEECKSSFEMFQKTFLWVLDKHAPLKKKTVRANEAPYMTKQLRKAIMTRSRLQNRHHKLKTEESNQKFKRQRNFCNRLYKRERKRFYENLKPNDITDNEKF